MTVEYSTSWSFIGGNPKKRWNTVQITTERGKTTGIKQVKSFATEKEAKDYAGKLGKKLA